MSFGSAESLRGCTWDKLPATRMGPSLRVEINYRLASRLYLSRTHISVILLFNRFPTGSQGASPSAHFNWRVRYRLSWSAASRLASDIDDLGVVAFGAVLPLVGSEEGASEAGDVPTLLVVAPLTAARTISAIRARR